MRAVAEDFWTEVGQPEPYPRDLKDSVIWALPVAVLEMRRLTVGSVEDWLRWQDIPLTFGCQDRSLRGCLVSFGGKGLVLLDGNDPEDERRFSLAHEVAHFLLDYLLPRRRAIERLGACIVEVLDGRRPATAQERVDALLGDVPVGTHTHLLERTASGTIGRAGIMGVESRADRLALELLAPEAEVRRRVPDVGRLRVFGQAVGHTTNVLRDAFGLPPRIAEGYGTSLCRSWYGGPSFGEWLGL